MALALSLLCSLFSLYLSIDYFLLDAKAFFSFPAFAGTLSAVVALALAYMEYKAARTKKQRALPMALLLLGALFGIAAALSWLFTLMS